MYMEVAATFRLLGDEARLRILRLLVEERLNVTELTGILGIAQSGVSRHLGLLPPGAFELDDADFLDINHVNPYAGRPKLSRQLARRAFG